VKDTLVLMRRPSVVSFRLFVVAGLLCAGRAGAAGAQTQWSDTTRLGAIRQAVIHVLESDIAAAAGTSKVRPWTIRTVGTDSARWQQSLTRIRVMLNARTARKTDATVAFLEIDESAHTDTSSRYSVAIGARSRAVCGGQVQWMVGEMSYVFIVEGRSSTWTARQIDLPVDGAPAECAPR
jgi:hypothetical protein